MKKEMGPENSPFSLIEEEAKEENPLFKLSTLD